MKKLKKYLEKTTTKIILILLILAMVLIGLSIQKEKENSKAEYPKSLVQEFYAYSDDLDVDPAYEIKVTLYMNSERMYKESYVEYFHNGTLVKKEMIR